MLESKFQADLIKDLKDLFPGCIILKNDANYLQGFPDLLILHGERWAALEVKASYSSPYRPNQEYYLDKLAGMSYSATIYPENAEEIIDALQRALAPRRLSRISQR